MRGLDGGEVGFDVTDGAGGTGATRCMVGGKSGWESEAGGEAESDGKFESHGEFVAREESEAEGRKSSTASPSQAISPRTDPSNRLAIPVLLVCRPWRAVPAPFRPCQGGVGANGTSTYVA